MGCRKSPGAKFSGSLCSPFPLWLRSQLFSAPSESRRGTKADARGTSVLTRFVVEGEAQGTLFLHKHQLAVFDSEIFHVVGKLELIALLGEVFLQHFVDQRCRHGKIADLDLGGIEGGITIFGAEMSGEGEIDVFAGDLREKLTANDVSIHGDLVILDIVNPARKLHRTACAGRVGGG